MHMIYVNVLLKMCCFLVFSFIQSLVINGIRESFQEGMIFSKVPGFVKKYLGEYYSKPIVGCIRCMSSFWGGLMYWPSVIAYFGFQPWEFPVYVANVFVLVYLNWYLYKRQ